jgi:IclR family transcriptional regulator, acetate operon repressor
VAHVPAERCLEIIELLADGAREMPLREISERLRLPKSGAHRLLATLVQLGWAVQDPGTGFYRLTMRLAVLGQRFYVASGVPDICQPLLDRLAAECREFVRLSVFDGGALVWIAHAQGVTGGVGLVYQPADTTGVVPLYATASGKAWLATLSAEDAAHYVMRDGGFAHADLYGPNVVRTIHALLKDLRTTASRGYGLAINEAEPGVSAIGAAIRSGPQGAAVGTVSIAGPSVRLDAARIEMLAPLVVRCASELSVLWPLRARVAPVPASDAAAAAPGVGAVRESRAPERTAPHSADSIR